MPATPHRLPVLKRCFKKRFAFRLSAPSFIYPAGYAENVAALGPFVDEIELLLFESRPDSWPSRSVINQLMALAGRHDLSFNIHLPLDLELGAADRTRRSHDTRRLIEIVKWVRPLPTSLYTLHLDFRENDPNPSVIQAWQGRTLRSLDRLLHATSLAPQRIGIETLDYPPEWFTPIVDRLNLSVCVDTGHVLRYGFNLKDMLTQFGGRLEMIHLHGATHDQDHLALDRLAPPARTLLQAFLQSFHGTVSVEVFNFERLQISLDVLERMMASGETRP
ncbi:MAG: hypothetical protein C4519_14125 [Desulfobacteraceae bacterium]|nr:MAG: hypothetical protein C4519_14125 [Desulfobacteraceae bacterium]